MEENERAQDMRTGQDKKEFMPNFLKDLNTEILEQLTKGSSEKNVVGLAGDVKELKAVEAVCGLRFKGYLGLVEVERPSGITDTLVVAFAWDTPYKSTQGVEFDVLREYPMYELSLLAGNGYTQPLTAYEKTRYYEGKIEPFPCLALPCGYTSICFSLSPPFTFVGFIACINPAVSSMPIAFASFLCASTSTAAPACSILGTALVAACSLLLNSSIISSSPTVLNSAIYPAPSVAFNSTMFYNFLKII